jgi:RimJ/RimL family protein N-acetyltransferase
VAKGLAHRDQNDGMEWPIRFPEVMRSGSLSVRAYRQPDATDLVGALGEERVWQHMSRPAPPDAATLDDVIRSRLAEGDRCTFTVRQDGRAVGITSVKFDPADPAGVEIGGTLLDPRVWGTGVNTAVKRLLLAVIFRAGAEWVQLRTDERNARSAAAIRKLRATDLGLRPEPLLRRDGTRRRSRVFRIGRPEP